jgi:hypothetical protein
MNADGLKIRGRVRILVRRLDGRLETIKIPNLVTTVGKALFASILSSASNRPNAMAWGASSVLANENQVDLQGTELARVATGVGVVLGNEITYTGSHTAGSQITIQEGGLFNSTTPGPGSGTMVSRWTTGPITLAVGELLTMDWTLEVG